MSPLRIGLYIGTRDRPELGEVVARIARAEQQGFQTAWVSQLDDFDALGLLAVAGGATQRIELGTWVVPAQPRHPVVLAQQALTVQAASRNRLCLAIGASHRVIIERQLGLDFSQPALQMREYLSVLKPLLAGAPARFAGERYRVASELHVPGATRPPLLVAALGPQMLDVAGELADGIAVWLGNAHYLERFALPRLRAAAQAAARREPRVACGFAIALTHDLAAARRSATAYLERSARLPSYQSALTRGEAGSAADVALLGSENAILDALRGLARLGVNDLCAVLFEVDGDPDARTRTYRWLSELAQKGI